MLISKKWTKTPHFTVPKNSQWKRVTALSNKNQILYLYVKLRFLKTSKNSTSFHRPRRDSHHFAVYKPGFPSTSFGRESRLFFSSDQSRICSRRLKISKMILYFSTSISILDDRRICVLERILESRYFNCFSKHFRYWG